MRCPPPKGRAVCLVDEPRCSAGTHCMTRLGLAVSHQASGAREYKHARNPEHCQGRYLRYSGSPQIFGIADAIRRRRFDGVAANVGRQWIATGGRVCRDGAWRFGQRRIGGSRRSATSSAKARREDRHRDWGDDDRQRDRCQREFTGRDGQSRRCADDGRRFGRQLHLRRLDPTGWDPASAARAAASAWSWQPDAGCRRGRCSRRAGLSLCRARFACRFARRRRR